VNETLPRNPVVIPLIRSQVKNFPEETPDEDRIDGRNPFNQVTSKKLELLGLLPPRLAVS